MIDGINHITIAVNNISRSFQFYADIMGFTPLCRSEQVAYFLVGKPDDIGCLWFCLDYDREQARQPSPCSSHIAFSVSAENFMPLSARIMAAGMPSFKENSSPGESLYFLDPDGHKLEIHVGDWRSRIEAKKKQPGKWTNVEWFI